MKDEASVRKMFSNQDQARVSQMRVFVLGNYFGYNSAR